MFIFSSKSTLGSLIPLLLMACKMGVLMWYNKKHIWSLSPVPVRVAQTLGISLLTGVSFVRTTRSLCCRCHSRRTCSFNRAERQAAPAGPGTRLQGGKVQQHGLRWRGEGGWSLITKDLINGASTGAEIRHGELQGR